MNTQCVGVSLSRYTDDEVDGASSQSSDRATINIGVAPSLLAMLLVGKSLPLFWSPFTESGFVVVVSSRDVASKNLPREILSIVTAK